jgi:hypothetical protein
MPRDTSKFKDVYNADVSPASRFGFLDGLRTTRLDIARECSALTLPSVVPPDGQDPDDVVMQSQQSHGARLVNNMVNQIMLIIFPAGMGFFKLDFSDKDMKEVFKSQVMPDGRSMYEAARGNFISLEHECNQTFESSGYREKATMIIQQLVIAGSCLYITNADDNLMYLLRLEDWACVRNNNGDLLEIVYRELIDGELQYVRCWHNSADEVGIRWLIQREDANGNTLAKAIVMQEDFPVNIPVWSLSIGEDYGRGQVEENLADLRIFDSGSKITTDSAAAMGKVIFTVAPNGRTKIEDIAGAKNCSIVSGVAEEIGTVQANKHYDLQHFIGHIEGIKRSLDYSFMMPDVIRRQAERVTAEEIQLMARELEKSKSGVYSSLTNSVQMPLAQMTLKLTMRKSLVVQSNPVLSQLEPVIVTGIQGLGRGFELESTLQLLSDVTAIPAMVPLIKYDQLLYRLANLRGVELMGLVKTQEELMAEQQQSAMDQAAMGAAPELIKGAMTNG